MLSLVQFITGNVTRSSLQLAFCYVTYGLGRSRSERATHFIVLILFVETVFPAVTTETAVVAEAPVLHSHPPHHFKSKMATTTTPPRIVAGESSHSTHLGSHLLFLFRIKLVRSTSSSWPLLSPTIEDLDRRGCLEHYVLQRRTKEISLGIFSPVTQPGSATHCAIDALSHPVDQCEV